MTPSAFSVGKPEHHTTPVVFASPHSGRVYPEEFLRTTILDRRTIRSSEDAYVDDLISDAPRFGAQTIAAEMPRAFVDLNRSAEELDPAVVHGLKRVTHNPRISSGLGVIPRVVANGRAIYRGKLTLDEAHDRIESFWHPYHRQLQNMLDQTRHRFGRAILIDMHSMPHEALDSLNHHSQGRPDVVLGDRFGAASHGEIVDHVEDAFRSAGLRVTRNAPFAGAFITQHYGRPSKNQHVVQIEIDRALYMNEETIKRAPHFDEFKSVLNRVLAEIADIGRASQMPLAAE